MSHSVLPPQHLGSPAAPVTVSDAASSSRRGFLRIALAGSAAVGLTGLSTATARAATTSSATTGTAGTGAAATLPGRAPTANGAQMLHTDRDLAFVAEKVAAGEGRWARGWDRLLANRHSAAGWRARPAAVVYRGTGSPENYMTLANDVHAAYQNALRWRIAGTEANGDCARDILNAWSATLTKVDGTSDLYLAAGIYGYQLANAAELMRGYPGFDLDRFLTMMTKVFYPVSSDFLRNHNGAYITNYWANWDICSIANVLAVGILARDRRIIKEARDYARNGAGNGSLENAAPTVLADGTAQWIEAGRDQGHTLMGIGLMATVCEMAWNQDVDLYGRAGRRFLRAAEYVARYNLGYQVDYPAYTWRYGKPGVWGGSQTFTCASPVSRGQARPVWALVENHYVGRLGKKAPAVSAIVGQNGPEGGGGDYGPNSGGFDALGFGTLTAAPLL